MGQNAEGQPNKRRAGTEKKFIENLNRGTNLEGFGQKLFADRLKAKGKSV